MKFAKKNRKNYR